MKMGFIGCGNMATAMIQGIVKKGAASPGEVMATARSEATRKKIREELGILLGENNSQAAAFADILFLAVKPRYYEEVIREIRDSVREETLVVSIAPGKTLDWLEEQFEKPVKLIRAMPNTPAMVGEGMTGEELERVRTVCGSFGLARQVTEDLMDVVTSVSGSSPAYVFLLIEAMADGAVADGMPRDAAYEFAAQAVLGSARMVLETGLHPGVLKDMVCSPGGTTMEAVRVLEEKGLRSSIIEAMKACVRKSRGM